MRLLIPSSIKFFLAMLVLSCPARAEQPPLSSILGTWVGYDKSSVPGQLYQLELVLEAASGKDVRRPEHGGQGPDCGNLPQSAENSRRRSSKDSDSMNTVCDALREQYERTSTKPYSWTQGESLTGRLSGKRLDMAPGIQADNFSETIFGEYFADTGVLHLERDGHRRYRSMRLLGVTDQPVTAMAIVQTDAAVNQTPFALYRGQTVPPSLQTFIERETTAYGRPTSSRNYPQTADTTSRKGAQNEGRARYQEEVKALQAQIQQATRARDKDRVAELRQQLKQVKQEYRSQLGSRSGKTTAGTGGYSGETSSCPSQIIGWVEELARRDESLEENKTLMELSNLFRPSIFQPSHEKSFTEMNAEEVQRLLLMLQRNCNSGDSTVALSQVNIPLKLILSDRPGMGRVEAGLAGLAGDIVADWKERVLRGLDSASSLQTLEDLRYFGPQIAHVLWSSEASELQGQVMAARSDAVRKELFAHLDALDKRLAEGDVTAIQELYDLGQGSLVAKVAVDDRAAIETRFWQSADRGIASYVDHFRSSLEQVPPGKQRLAEGYRWFDRSNPSLRKFEQRDAFREYVQWFYQDREHSYQVAKPQLISELSSINTRPAVMSWGYGRLGFRLPGDMQHSTTGQEVEILRQQRQAEIERTLHIARVGEGPFGPDDPGAIYLNAIYRLDRQQIAEEDSLFVNAYMQLFPIADTSGLLRMSSLLSGGSGNPMEARQAFYEQMRNATIVTPLLGFFAVSYEHVYPRCLDSTPVVFKKTEQWEMITRNGFGVEISRYGFQNTQHYRINRRHADVFRSLEGHDAGPGSLQSYLDIWGGPKELRDAAEFIEDTFIGLRNAMRDNACDSALITRLDNNMLTLWREINAL